VVGRSGVDQASRLKDSYSRLYAQYGTQGWWPGETAFEVVVGAILTQSASWVNVERALANLKAAGALSAAALHGMGDEEIARLVRPSGYYKSKARKLKAFVEMLYGGWDGHLHCLLRLPLEELRAVLLRTHGIGPETADSIALYGGGKPTFVIDAYTRRVFSRTGVRPETDTYEGWRRWFMEGLPPDPGMFNEYHALIVRLGKDVCRKRQPECRRCPLQEVCETGRESG
jgi:endonuclease-3 related protein